MSYLLKQSSTAKPLQFFMIDSADHISGKTGLSPTVKIGKNGGTGAAPSGAVTEIDATNLPGWYKVAGNATDTNTLGPLALHASATGADPCDREYTVVAFDPDDAAALGLSRVDAAITSRLAPTVAARTLDVSATGEAGVDLANVGSPTTTLNLSGTTIAAVSGAVGSVTAAVTVGTNNDKTGYGLSAAAVQAMWDALTSALTTAGSIGKKLADFVLGTDSRVKVSADAHTSGETVAAVTGAVGSVTGNVGGNVTGSVGSVTGAVGSVTGNVGGNVVGSVASVTAAVATTSNVKKNQALSSFTFLMTDSTNHAPATGKTVSVTRAIDGGAQAAGTLSAVTEIANGLYKVNFGAGDLNGNVIVLRATATGCDDTFERIITVP